MAPVPLLPREKTSQERQLEYEEYIRLRKKEDSGVRLTDSEKMSLTYLRSLRK